MRYHIPAVGYCDCGEWIREALVGETFLTRRWLFLDQFGSETCDI